MTMKPVPLIRLGELYPGTHLRRRYTLEGQPLTPCYEGPAYLIDEGKRLRNAEDIACDEADQVGLRAVFVYGQPYGKVGAEWVWFGFPQGKGEGE